MVPWAAAGESHIICENGGLSGHSIYWTDGSEGDDNTQMTVIFPNCIIDDWGTGTQGGGLCCH